jgi:hypothetical protein
MTLYYMIGTQLDEQEYCTSFAEPLNSSSLEDAISEGHHALVEAAFDDESPFPSFQDVDEAQVVAIGERAELNLDQCRSMYEVHKARRADSQGEWEQRYEELRDEVGHWRTLHRRGQAPAAQVSLLEDRLHAHIAAKP